VKDARKSAGYALVLIAILYTTAPAIAVFKTNLIETVNGKDYSSMPAWFTKWETTGLLTFKDGDGKIQYTTTTPRTQHLAAQEAKGNKGSELTIDKDIMVLANPEIANLPNCCFSGCQTLAAALSTAAGLLLVISASVSHDIIKK
jgi:cation/acetate symporter